MMEEADKALASVDKNRLSIQVKKAEPTPDTTPMPQMKTPQTPPAREMAQTPPETPEQPVPKAIPVMEAEPVTRTTPNQDPNSFTPFTRVQQTKGTISNRGSRVSVDAEESPKGRYIRQVTGQVEKKWHIYRVLRRDGVTYGSLEVVFYVNKKGKVEDLRVVNDKESNPVLTGFTIQAIRDREGLAIGTEKKELSTKLGHFARMAGERLIEELDNIPIGQLPVAMGIALDKKAQLDGEASAIVEHRTRREPDPEDIRAYLAGLRSATPKPEELGSTVGSGDGEPAQLPAPQDEGSQSK
jgi:hypothetical protein